MNALVNASTNPTMSSREIAELTGKRHDNVMRTIRDLIDGQILTPQIEESTFEHVGNSYKCFLLNKRDSLVTVARLSPEFTAAVVDRWQELEAKQTTFDITNPVHLLQAIEVQARLSIQLAAERDHAIATKAEIGSKREATAMATASAASRKAKALESQLDQVRDYASVKKVEAVTKRKFEWNPLKKWSIENEVEIKKAFDPNFPNGVNTYSSSAWLAVYNVDIYALSEGVAA
jgi:phage regulator Rha-like protein